MRAEDLTVDDVVVPQRAEISDILLRDSHIENYRYCSLKLDGHWTAVYKDEYGLTSAWSRRNKNITSKVRHMPWFRHIELYGSNLSWILGEMWGHDIPCSSIPTVVKEKGVLNFAAFYTSNVRLFEELTAYCYARNISVVPWKAADPYAFTAEECQNFYNEQTKFFSPADGLVFSDGCGVHCRRYKPDKTMDLIYCGYDFGRTGSKYQYTVGNIRLKSAEGIPVAKASGMSDAERRYILEKDQLLRGKVVEVTYKDITVKGRLRHCSFIRFRTDKEPEECTLHQDMKLHKIHKG